MKTIIVIGIFLLTPVLNFTFDKEQMARKQLNNRLPSELREKIPFLDQGFEQMNYSKIQAENIFTLHFEPNESTYHTFARLTGTSIFKARFVVSWYIFKNQSDIPVSTDDILVLLNTQKPIYFSHLTFINIGWESLADLPHKSNRDDYFVFAYVSYPNTKGVLVPMAAQSFYKDYISGVAKKIQHVDLNVSMLNHWKSQGYL